MRSSHIDSILENGFTIIRKSFSLEKANDLKNELKIIQSSWKNPEQSIPFLNRSTPLIYNPDHKSIKILLFLLRENPLIHEILLNFLNDEWYRRLPDDEPNYILRAAIARSSGEKSLPLHIDSFIPSSGSKLFVMQALFALDQSNSRNGSTIVVPSSHKSDAYANQDAIKDAISLDLEPGDVALWDSRLWHGAKPNISGNDRWSIIATFTRWWIKQNYQTPKILPKDFADSLEPHELTIMGFNSYPPYNEYERIDIKKGHTIS